MIPDAMAIADGDPHTEADQLAVYETLKTGFERAAARAGCIERDLLIAGFRVRLRFAGDGLLPSILPALAHLATDDIGEPDLRIALFDSASTGTRLPFLAERTVELLRLRWWEHLEGRREIRGLNGQRIRSVFHLGPDILSLLDRRRDEALYWVETAAALPYYERGSPLMVLLNWWLSEHHRFLVHAAGIGGADGGLLLTAKGGSGKSTTTLACLLAGLGTVGDDYAVVDPDQAIAYSLFNTVKLKGPEDVARFPALQDCFDNLPRMAEGEKAMLFLHRHFPGRLLPSLPLKAILVPRFADRPETEIRPAPSALAFKALAPSTMFQLPGNARAAFQGLAALVRTVPAYEIALGHDIGRIPVAVRRFLGHL
jgi:hypothetical protein